MKNIWTLRDSFNLVDGVAISKQTFAHSFTKTKERITFTFNGWDGKSYDGETRNAFVYRTNTPGYEEARFIKVGKGLHYIDEEQEATEKATGKAHKVASWLMDVHKA